MTGAAAARSSCSTSAGSCSARRASRRPRSRRSPPAPTSASRSSTSTSAARRGSTPSSSTARCSCCSTGSPRRCPRPAIPRELLERAALVLLDYIEDDTDGFRVLTRDAPVTSGERLVLLADRRGRPQGRAHPRPPVRRPRATTRSWPSSTARRWSAWSRWSGSGGWTRARRTSSEVAAHLVNLAYNGLSHLDPAPSRRRPAPRRADSGAQRTSRAPGTGPCTARTVRKTPVAGQLGGQPHGGVPRPRASAATVGPGAAHQRAERPRPSVAARSARPQLRAAALSAGACRSLRERGGQAGRRPAAQRGEHRARAT